MIYLFGWIENFGVVPLLANIFFLFEPAFFLFSFLLILVCCVLDAIIFTPETYIFKILRTQFLSFIQQVVKILLLALTLGPICSAAMAKDWFLSIGEQVEISTSKMKKFSVGNSQVIKHKHNISKQTLLIKAKSLGFSDVIIWQPEGKTTHRFYVSSKREHLNKMEALQALNHTSLKAKIWGDFVYVTGKVTNEADYLIYSKVKEAKNINFIWKINLDKNVRNSIFKKVYEEAYHLGVKGIHCSIHGGIDILCKYKANKKMDFSTIANQLGIKIQKERPGTKVNNYKLTLYLFSIESREDAQGTFGIDRIESELESALSKGASFTVGKILYQDNETSIKTITQQSLETSLDESFQLELGTEVPIKNTTQSTSTTEWKFSGLRFSGKLQIKEDTFFLKQKSFLTTPSNEGISGPKTSSAIFLRNLDFVKAFEISFKNSSKSKSGIPILKDLPFFSSNTEQLTYKKVIGYIKLESTL